MSSFEIFPKNSASPTIMIKTTSSTFQGAPIVLKIWSNSASLSALDKQFLRALEYEQNVYSRLIDPHLKQHPNAPFMKYVGEGKFVSFKELADFIGAITKQEKHYLSVALSEYLMSPLSRNDYDRTKLSRKIIIANENILKKAKFSAIMLPYVEYRTLGDYLSEGTLEQSYKFLVEVIHGIKIMYEKMKLVHNDLHYANVLIENRTNKVMIYDYDRAYKKGIPNPLLSPDKCSSNFCGSSQCNVYNEGGFAIDFYKILSYVAVYREDPEIIAVILALADPDRYATITRNANMIIKWFSDSSNSFFSENGCSYLQFPNQMMNYIRTLFGPISDIVNRVTAQGMPDFSNVASSVAFSFSGNEVMKRPVMRDFRDVVKQGNVKQGNVKQGETKRKSKGKYSNKLKPKRSGRLPPPRSIVQIIQENDLRKYGPAKK